MSESHDTTFGVVRAPKVPFDLKGVTLAAAGFVALFLVNLALAAAWSAENPIGQLLQLFSRPIGRVAFLGDGYRVAMGAVWGGPGGTLPLYELRWWQAVLTGALFFGVWSLFGGAVLRASALRLTRDETISLRQALSFSLRQLPQFLLAPVLVAAIALFFSFLNAAAGAVMSVWVIGSSILTIVLFPLVLISSLFVILTLLAGLVGLPLIWSGIAFECNGALEGLSRAFSYIFYRPFQFFLGYFLVFVFMSAILLVGIFFEDTAKTTVRAWMWRPELKEAVSRPAEPVHRLEGAYRDSQNVRSEGIANLRNISHADWKDVVGFFFMWLFLNVFLFGFKGYALYVMLGGTAWLYLQLRSEVDGTDPEEIHVEEEEAGPDGSRPRWVSEPAAAPPSPPGPPAPPAAPAAS